MESNITYQVAKLRSAIEHNTVELMKLKNLLNQFSTSNKNAKLALSKLEKMLAIDVNKKPHNVSTIDFLEIVGELIEKYNLRSSTRKREVVMCRQYLMYQLNIRDEYSFQEIGDLFGGKHHATVIHSVNACKELISVKDKIFMETISQLSLELEMMCNKISGDVE